MATRTSADLLSVVGFVAGVMLGFLLGIPELFALAVVVAVLAIIGLVRSYTPLLVSLFAGAFVGFVLNLIF